VQTVRILLAEDHVEMRRRLKRLLVHEPEFEVVADVGDGIEAARLASELKPDVLVTDLAMPGLHGLEVIHRVRLQTPHTRIVIVSIRADEPYIVEAFHHGALGYVRKDEVGRHLVSAIHAVLAGKHYLSSSLAELASRLTAAKLQRAESASAKSLSTRERLVLQLVSQGYSDAEVARQFKLSSTQATQLRKRLLRKLGFRTSADLTAFACQNGWLAGRE